MASEQTLRAVFTVLDRTAEPLHQINMRFARMSAPLTNIRNRLSEFAEETGLKRLGEHASEALEKVKGLTEGLFEVFAPLAAAGSAAGLFEIAKSTAEWGEQLKLASVATGMSTERLAGWHYAAKLANVDADQLDRGLQYLNRNISEAAQGKAKDVATILAKMGLHNASGHLVATSDALKAVAAEAKKLVDGGNVQLADDMMSKLFGERSGMQLLPLFAGGPEAINKILESAKEHGIALTEAQAEQAAKFAEGYKEMEAGVFGLKTAIGSQLFPVLNPVIKRMTEWVDANREWIATGIGDAIRDLAGWVRSIDWNRVGRGLRDVADAARDVARDVFGIVEAINDLVGTKTTVALFGLAFTQVGRDIAGLGLKLVAFPIGKFLLDFGRMIPLIKDARGVMIALNLAMDANPIFVVVAALTALAAALYEVYKHWNDVKGLLNGSNGVGAILKLPGGDSGYVDPNTGQFIPTAPLTSKPGGGPAGTAAGAGATSSHEVNVNVAGLPPGSRADARATRRGNSSLNLSVGYAMAN